MVRRKPRYALHILCRSREPVEKFGYQRGTLQLLKRSGRLAVFLAAQRACNVVYDGGQLQNLLRVGIQPLKLADGLAYAQTFIKWLMSCRLPL